MRGTYGRRVVVVRSGLGVVQPGWPVAGHLGQKKINECINDLRTQ